MDLAGDLGRPHQDGVAWLHVGIVNEHEVRTYLAGSDEKGVGEHWSP